MNTRNFFAELKRRNVYKVAVAYAVVSWLLVQIATQVFPFFDIPNWAVRVVVIFLVLGFPVALVWRGRSRSRRKESNLNRRSGSRIHRLATHGRKLIGITIASRSAPGACWHSSFFRPRLMAERIPPRPGCAGCSYPRAEHRGAAICRHVAGEGPGILLRRHLRGVAERVSQGAAAQGGGAHVVILVQGKRVEVPEIARQLGVVNVIEGSVGAFSLPAPSGRRPAPMPTSSSRRISAGFARRWRHVLLLDMAIHTFDAARYMVERRAAPASTAANGSRRVPGTGRDRRPARDLRSRRRQGLHLSPAAGAPTGFAPAGRAHGASSASAAADLGRQ